MSEPKRVPLQTLEFPESLGHATKKEKGEKGKQLAPSFRFTLVLPESNEKTCPEFNYAHLLKAAEKKRRKEQKRGEENATNGLDPFDDDDEDEDKLREIAKRFEAKYGTGNAGRKRHKFDDYVDLGAGYDENDSFIDNTDAYDEIVPEELTTAHGGFYINCGALEYKTSEGNSLLHVNNINNNNNNEDESGESSEDEAEAEESPKRSDKRVHSISDDDDTEDITGDHHPRKKPKLDENSEKKANHDTVIKKKKKHHLHHQQQQELDILNRRKNAVGPGLPKEKRDTLECEGAADEQDEKRKLEKQELTKPKAVVEKKFDIKRFEKKSSTNGLDPKKLDLKKFCGGKDSNIDDAIESVVNAGRAEDESSRDTIDSGKSRGIVGTESECDDMDKEESPLPESLPEDVKDIVNKLKVQTENSKEGKTKFFSIHVNSCLFSLEKKLRSLHQPNVRLQTYDHLAHFLPCSKNTLVNRAKKLFLQDVENRVKEPLQRLKAVVDTVMPSAMERYTKECQRVVDEKGIEGSPTDIDSSDGEDNPNKGNDKTKIPRRRFPWTEESKKLVFEIAIARQQYFEVLRPRKESMETFVAAFMDSEVRPLWPPGWVRLTTLMKYSTSEPIVKRKSKKPPKDVAASSSVNSLASSAATSVITACNAKVDTTNVNSIVASGQERVKTPTNFAKSSSAVSDNPINFTMSAPTSGKSSNDFGIERKQSSSKHKEKNNRDASIPSQYDNSIPVGISSNASGMAKITVVPTSQLIAQKAKSSHAEKFNPMDLTSGSLSITPVNDYQKSAGRMNSEPKKDVISITPYSEGNASSVAVNDTIHASQTGHHHSSSRPDVPFSTSQQQQQMQPSNYSMPNQGSGSSSHAKPVPLKHRILQESIDAKSERKPSEDRVESDAYKTERREKRREGKHKTQIDGKKRKEKHRIESSSAVSTHKTDVLTASTTQPLMSKEEQEQRQIEETMAATNFLSQIINDDPPRPASDKRKEPAVVLEDATGNVVQSTEQENDVQMVMRSLKELQELQEMKYSPSHSPVGGGMQKPSKSNVQYVGYPEDYQQRLYHKKDDKLRITKKEDAQW